MAGPRKFKFHPAASPSSKFGNADLDPILNPDLVRVIRGYGFLPLPLPGLPELPRSCFGCCCFCACGGRPCFGCACGCGRAGAATRSPCGCCCLRSTCFCCPRDCCCCGCD